MNPITLKPGQKGQCVNSVKVGNPGQDVTPEAGTTYDSNTTGVATVDANGLVTAGTTPGNSLITATGTVKSPFDGSILPFTDHAVVIVPVDNTVTASMDIQPVP